jgi:two-component system phosphate regulon response regulator PhoB
MKKILVVEDAEDIRELVAFKLRGAGYDVSTAADGEAGVATARSIHPDLIVLDWMMPRMNGLDATVAVRADADLAQVPIILLTAKGQEQDVHRGFTVGVDDYIVKPFSPRELVSRVDAVLARVRLPR